MLAETVRSATRRTTASPPPVADRRAAEAATGRSIDASVHRGAAVDRALGDMGARAATIGRLVLMSSTAGPSSLRHELAHVAQNDSREADLDRPLALGSTVAPQEHHARTVGDGTAVGAAPVGDPQVVRRDEINPQAAQDAARSGPFPYGVGGGVSPAQIDSYNAQRREAEAARAQDAEREQAWKRGVTAHAAADMARLPRTIGDDLEGARLAVVSAKANLFRSLESSPNQSPQGFPPTGFADQWGAAVVAVEGTRPRPPSLATPQPKPEDLQPAHAAQAQARALAATALRGWYESLELWHDRRHHDQVELARIAERADAEKRKTGGESVEPRDEWPDIPLIRARVDGAANDAQWAAIVGEFDAATLQAERWARGSAGTKSQLAAALDAAQGFHQQLSTFAKDHPTGIKVPAIFYEAKAGVSTNATEVAPRVQAIPWEFYVWYKPDDQEWVLEDLHAKDKRTNTAGKSWTTKAMEVMYPSMWVAVDRPPDQLFEDLNHKLRFPKGELHILRPGIDEPLIVPTTEPDTWADYLGYAGMTVLVIGAVVMIVATDGAAAPFFVGSSVLGAGSTALRLYEKTEHGMDTAGDWGEAAFLIALDVATAGSIGSGALVKGAKTAAGVAESTSAVDVALQSTKALTRVAGKVYVPTTRAMQAGMTIQGVWLTAQVAQQAAALNQRADLTAGQKRDEMIKLVMMAMAAGLLFLGARGGGAEIAERTGATAKPLAGELAAESTARKAMNEAGHTGKDPPLVAIAEGEVKGGIEIRLPRNALGIITKIEIAVSESLSAPVEMCRMHLERARVMQRYVGLPGRVRELWGVLRAQVTGGDHVWMEHLLEAEKLEALIDHHLEQLARSEVEGALRQRFQTELAAYQKELDSTVEAIRRGRPPRGIIAQPGVKLDGPKALEGFEVVESGVAGTAEWVRPIGSGGVSGSLRVRYDKAAGRMTNRAQLESNRIVGLSMDDPGAARLVRSMGYEVSSTGAITRPFAYTGVGGRAAPEMVAIEVGPNRVVKLADEIRIEVTKGYRPQYSGITLTVDEILASVKAVDRSIPSVALGRTAPREGLETLLRRGRELGLVDYVRYHILGPGTGVEQTAMALAPEKANQFANHFIEGPIRRLLNQKHPPLITVDIRYTTFTAEELRPFVSGQLASRNEAFLRTMGRDGGSIDRFLKRVEYTYTIVTPPKEPVVKRAWIEVGPPGSGTTPDLRELH